MSLLIISSPPPPPPPPSCRGARALVGSGHRPRPSPLLPDLCSIHASCTTARCARIRPTNGADRSTQTHTQLTTQKQKAENSSTTAITSHPALHRPLVSMLPSPAVHRAQAILSHLAPRSTSGVINTSTSYPGPHEFSLDPAGVLTPEQRRSYDENGYILIKGLVSEEVSTQVAAACNHAPAAGRSVHPNQLCPPRTCCCCRISRCGVIASSPSRPAPSARRRR